MYIYDFSSVQRRVFQHPANLWRVFPKPRSDTGGSFTFAEVRLL